MQRREVTRGSIARTEERANTGRTGEAGKQIQIGEAREKRDERATKDKFSRRLNRIKMKKDKVANSEEGRCRTKEGSTELGSHVRQDTVQDQMRRQVRVELQGRGGRRDKKQMRQERRSR